MTRMCGVCLLAMVGLMGAGPTFAEEAVRISGTELLNQIEAHGAPLILDVRSAREYRAGHVPGAIHVPFWAAYWRADDLPLSGSRPVVIYCAHGPRAGVAKYALGLKDDPRVFYLEGHMKAWKKDGLPVTKGKNP
ncbi:MAG: rhodanese-like domain-containing protein [Pseudomonadota bacterium]|nr:rhodanese-like domain-containing protein [Pseudomonadota bacterium]